MRILDYIPGYNGGTSGGATSGSSGSEGTGPLSAYVGVLTQLGRSPVGFVVGAVISYILGGIETIVTSLLNAISVIFVGSDPSSIDGTMGLADLPIYVAGLVIDGTEPVGSAIIGTVDLVMSAAIDIASNAGPLAPLVLAGCIAVVFIAGAWILRTAVDILADAVPGLQGIIKP